MIQSTYFSPVFSNCLRFKRGPNFQGWGIKPILQNNWIPSIEGAWFLGRNQFWRTAELFCPPFCISILKLSRTQIFRHSLDFHVFCMIQRIFFSDFWNFYKLKRGDLISGGNQFRWKSQLFGSPFFISILKI